MARILPDKEIKKLLGEVIRDGEATLLNPHGIELRLGTSVRFLSTSEEMTIPPGHFIKIRPGESAMVSSLEHLDFSRETVGKFFPDCMLMAFITPTTTMVREGIVQAATKVDAGFRGQLNWGFRNSSYKDLILQNGEPIFKLTFFLLEGDELPDVSYGDRDKDTYQDTEGVLVSRRRVPADIPKSKTVASSFDKIDPTKLLSEAGHPFSHIGSELVAIQGRFEMVSRDFSALKSELDQRTSELGTKIEKEGTHVVDKIDESKKWLVEHVDNLVTKKFVAIVGTLIGAITLLYAALRYVQGFQPPPQLVVFLAAVAGIVILALTWLSVKRTK